MRWAEPNTRIAANQFEQTRIRIRVRIGIRVLIEICVRIGIVVSVLKLSCQYSALPSASIQRGMQRKTGSMLRGQGWFAERSTGFVLKAPGHYSAQPRASAESPFVNLL